MYNMLVNVIFLVYNGVHQINQRGNDMPTDLPPNFVGTKKKKGQRKMTFFERIITAILIPVVFLPMGLFVVIVGLLFVWAGLFIKPTIWLDVDEGE